MKTIIINCAGDIVLEDALVAALINLISVAGHEVVHTNHCDNSVSVISTVVKDIDAPEQSPAEPATQAAEVIPDPIDVPGVDTVCELPPANDITIDLPAISVDAVTSAPATEPSPSIEFNKKAAILNLSTFNSVPATCDPNRTLSVLRCSNVSKEEDGYVCFDYCSTQYRYPVGTDENAFPICRYPAENNVFPVCNKDAIFTPTSIRVTIQFDGSLKTFPCLLCVEEKATDEKCSIVFGSDLLDTVTQENPNYYDQISAK